MAEIVREGSIEAIMSLKKLGFDEPIMLTGDNPRTANDIASELCIIPLGPPKSLQYLVFV